MLNFRRIILVAFAVFVLAAPYLAEARAGGGRSSMGSRGSRTYSPLPMAKPIERSTTAPTKAPNAAQPGFNGAQPAGAMPAMGGGNPFWRGVAGGFLGAGIASMLFGHSASAAGAGAGGGAGGALGGLLQILMLGGLGYFAYRMFRGRQGASFASPMSNVMPGNFASTGSGYAEQNTMETAPINIVENDKAAFEHLLIKTQQYWSEGELNKLRQVVTPEMVQYFSEEMSANASRGLANKVENVRLESAEVLESWREFELDYATVRLQWSAFDYMVSLDKNKGDDGYVVSGSNSTTELAEEVWTFARSAGGNWLLSAIQQVN